MDYKMYLQACWKPIDMVSMKGDRLARIILSCA